MTQTQKEMMALVGACTQDSGDKFLVDKELNDEFKKILTKKDFQIFNEDTEEKYDLIIEKTPSDLLKIDSKLTDKGIYITSASFTDKNLFSDLSKLFYIVMPYYFIEDDLSIKTLVFASKKLHPTADLIRHRSDFVENTHYYHTDIHLASFVLPKHIFESLKSFIRL